MKLEHQVCTQTQAQIIDGLFKKAGIEPLKSLWMWEYYENIGGKWGLRLTEPFELSKKEKYRAYSCAELGVMLGKYNCQSIGNVLEAKLRADKLIHLLDYQEDLKL